MEKKEKNGKIAIEARNTRKRRNKLSRKECRHNATKWVGCDICCCAEEGKGLRLQGALGYPTARWGQHNPALVYIRTSACRTLTLSQAIL